MTEMNDFDLDNLEIEEESQPEEGNNRTFVTVAGILGGILIISLVCIAVYAMVYLPRTRGAKATEAAEIIAQNTEVAMMSEMTAEARLWTSTPSITPTKAPKTATPSPTPVLAPTDTPEMAEDVVDPRTATVAALFTQQAEKDLTTTPVSTVLPDTGFMDNVGVPGLVALAASLVLVIFLARRLRTG
jgi:hypothetical protein